MTPSSSAGSWPPCSAGLDSPPGAVIGGLSLGVGLSYVSGYAGSSLVPLAALVILVAVLMLRPGGLFAASSERRV